MKKILLALLSTGMASPLLSQVTADTVNKKTLAEITIKAWQRRDISYATGEQNGFLTTGKKNEQVNLAGTNANIALKNGRQIFSKIPGVFVYDMDGSGNQVNIATRGLDPHRSWEYNIRQNGIIINSDMYGYPASHYSPPMESMEKIELIRGTGSLQYGAQFGGMINYVSKKPDTARAFGFESVNTVGSFNLFSSYNTISGTHKKFGYHAYYYRRHNDGYRANGGSDATAQYAKLQYQINKAILVSAALGRSKYLYHIPGPLTDSLFAIDPRMSTRARNYFSPDIYVPSISLEAQLWKQTKLSLVASGVFGKRSSVQLDAFANIPDTINPVTREYKNRQVDIDGFNSKTIEMRLLHPYRIGKVPAKLATGWVYMHNRLHRQQLGKGTTGQGYDLSLVEPGFGRDIYFKSNNLGLFAENVFQVTPRWAISPGIRFETGQSAMEGSIVYYTVNPLPTTIKHRFTLLGISSQYQLNKENLVYGGISQAYRPVIFKDIVPASTYEQIDKQLKDATGYNMEMGLRGKLGKYFSYDISYFTVAYRNRMGTLVLQDNTGQPYTYKTNIGNSVTKGLEIFMQYKFAINAHLLAGIFTSTAYTDAKYTTGQIATGTSNKSIVGNKVEAVPNWISRSGLDIMHKGFSATLLYSYTSGSFSDALNTVSPPPSGAKGYTPAYRLWDINMSWRITAYLTVRTGVNNIFNTAYFTKRPTFYPGPGIWPSDGRNMYCTVAINSFTF